MTSRDVFASFARSAVDREGLIINPAVRIGLGCCRAIIFFHFGSRTVRAEYIPYATFLYSKDIE